MRLSLLLAYLVLAGAAIYAHAMWRDETQAWLIARDSPSASALLHTLRYEGHPALWYLVLMPLTHLSRNPVTMQALNLVFAGAAVALVLWRAPLSRIERALFPFGYFTLYEYGVKSRSYALGFLLLMLLCVTWPRRRKYPVLMAFVLALLANVHLLLLVLSISAACALALDPRSGMGPYAEQPRAGWRANLLAAGVLLAGWMMAALTIRPPPDTGFSPNWYFSISTDRIHKTLDVFGALLTPYSSFLAIFSSILILLMIALRWKAAPQAALFYLLSAGGMLTLFYVKLPDEIWLHGTLFMAFVVTIWLSRTEAIPSVTGAAHKQLIPTFIVWIVLALQALYGLQAVRADMLHPLSNGRAVARYIRDHGWANEPIIGFPDKVMSPIAGYLGVDRMYYGNAQRWGSFTFWDQRRREPVDTNKFLQNAAALGPRETLIVSVLSPIDPQALSHYGFDRVSRFIGARTPDENYDLYRRDAGVRTLPAH